MTGVKGMKSKHSKKGMKGRKWTVEQKHAKSLWAKSNEIAKQMHTPEARKKISQSIRKNWQTEERQIKHVLSWTKEKRIAARERMNKLVQSGKYTPYEKRVWTPNWMSWLERKFLHILGDCRLHGFQHNFEIEVLDEQNNLRKFWADFCFPELKLIMECDSEMWHSTYSQKAHDATRQELLEQAGYTVIRFSSKQILSEREATKSAIKQAVEEAARKRKTLLPQ